MQKVFRSGHSLALTVPVDFVHTVGVEPGAKVKTRIDFSRMRVTYEFSGVQQLPLVAPKSPVIKKNG
jgi:hypothetical protein